MEPIRAEYETLKGTEEGYAETEGYKITFSGVAAFAQMYIYRDKDDVWWGRLDTSNGDGEYVDRYGGYRMGDEVTAREWLAARLQRAEDYIKAVNSRQASRVAIHIFDFGTLEL